MADLRKWHAEFERRALTMCIPIRTHAASDAGRVADAGGRSTNVPDAACAAVCYRTAALLGVPTILTKQSISERAISELYFQRDQRNAKALRRCAHELGIDVRDDALPWNLIDKICKHFAMAAECTSFTNPLVCGDGTRHRVPSHVTIEPVGDRLALGYQVISPVTGLRIPCGRFVQEHRTLLEQPDVNYNTDGMRDAYTTDGPYVAPQASAETPSLLVKYEPIITGDIRQLLATSAAAREVQGRTEPAFSAEARTTLRVTYAIAPTTGRLAADGGYATIDARDAWPLLNAIGAVRLSIPGLSVLVVRSIARATLPGDVPTMLLSNTFLAEYEHERSAGVRSLLERVAEMYGLADHQHAERFVSECATGALALPPPPAGARRTSLHGAVDRLPELAAKVNKDTMASYQRVGTDERARGRERLFAFSRYVYATETNVIHAIDRVLQGLGCRVITILDHDTLAISKPIDITHLAAQVAQHMEGTLPKLHLRFDQGDFNA